MNNSHTPARNHDDPSRYGPFSSAIIHRVLIAICIILVLLIMGVLAIRKFLIDKIPPSALAEIHKLETTTLSLPRDWHQPADLPPIDVLAFHKNFEAAMESLREKHKEFLLGDRSFLSVSTNPGFIENYRTSRTLTEADRTSFTAVVADLQPIIDQTSAAVRLQGYTMETDFLLAPISFFDLHTFAQLMCIVAEEQARQGECTRAIETALLPLRLVNRPEQSYIMTHLMAVGVNSMAAEAVFMICQKCNDPATYQHAVDSLNELYDGVLPGDIADWYHEEMVALRFAAAYGYPVDLSPQNHANLLRQRAELWRQPYYEHLVSTLPPSDPRAVEAKKNVASIKRGNPNIMAPGIARLYKLVTGVDPILVLQTIVPPDLDEATTRSKVSKAAIDLARLTAAAKVAGTGVKDSSATEAATTVPDVETITAYLTPPPVDPFTSGSYSYSSTHNRFYSAGPDLDDDKGDSIYDPTNGTNSNGDVLLTGWW